MAGCPVMLNHTVNGEKVKTRRQYSCTSSSIMSIQPSFGGNMASAGVSRHSREGCREIFDEKGYTGQRPIRQAGYNGLAAIVVELHDHGVHAGVTGFHPHDGGVEQFIGGDLATPHQVSQSQRIVVLVFGKSTHACHSHARTRNFSVSSSS